MAILEETRLSTSEGINEVLQYKLLNDESDDETTSTAVDVSDASSFTLLVEAGAGVSGGVVTLEAARTSSYTGTWASLGTITTNAASQTFLLTVDSGDSTGVPVPYVRARISTAITGGTLDVYLIKKK